MHAQWRDRTMAAGDRIATMMLDLADARRVAAPLAAEVRRLGLDIEREGIDL